MKIANPIYDAVFKYMMNDNKVAKLLLSAIIGEEILELEFRPTEYNIPLKDSITVFRMDFSALVQYQDKSKQLIIIEIQKAKLPTDIMRFRKYLGKQYANPNNSVPISADKKQNIGKKALPILSIYFLGHALEHAKDIPVIKVARTYYDLATGETLPHKEEFIESLTHDSFIIQIPFVNRKVRTELEQVLSIFDQNNIGEDYHILNIRKNSVPERFRPILRRLITAIAEETIRDQMEAEDDIIEEMQTYTRIIQEKEQQIEEKEQQIQEKDKILGEKEQQIGEKEQQIEEKEQQIEEKEQQIEEKEQQIGEKEQQIGEKEQQIGNQKEQLQEQAKIIEALKQQLKNQQKK